jgi:uncharacterized protein HemX
MTHETMRIEGQILAYASRQRHAEDLLERARMHVGDAQEHAEVRSQLDGLGEEHSRLSAALDRLKGRDPSEWLPDEIEQLGPMAVWDALAAELEPLVERLTKH